MANKKANVSKEILFDLYYNQGKTLQDIGDIYGVTRERVRQLMSGYDLSRLRRRTHRHPAGKRYNTLDEYFADYDKRVKDSRTMIQLLDYTRCEECGYDKFLVAHHIRYPAMSEDDIQILCRFCHKLKHNKGMTYEKQLLLFLGYKQGSSYKELMKQFGISKPLVYLIIRKIKNGYRTTRG